MNIVNLGSTRDISFDMVGSKAWNLSVMIGKQLPVPVGFVITSAAFQSFLAVNDLTERHSIDLEEAFLKASIPPAIVEEIAKHYELLNQQAIYAVAVRSSSSLEDLNSASFAGQYETILNVRTFEDLLVSIKRCWFSFFSPLVQEYATHQHISLDSLNMGVLIQGMVNADVSGVVFSKNPVTNNTQEIMINASYGLGEAIVSGLVTPDQFLINKDTGEITKELGLKELKVLAAQAGTEEVETSIEEQNALCLTEEEVNKLVQLTQQIEQFYTASVDIEFAIANNEIYVLQVRPITT